MRILKTRVKQNKSTRRSADEASWLASSIGNRGIIPLTVTDAEYIYLFRFIAMSTKIEYVSSVSYNASGSICALNGFSQITSLNPLGRLIGPR